jgi:hypothetical protein
MKDNEQLLHSKGKLRTTFFKKAKQTLGDKVKGREGNSPNY